MIQLVLALSLVGFQAFGEVVPIKEVFEPKGNFPPADYVKVAVIAESPLGVAPVPADAKTAEEYKQTNREFLAEQIRVAAAAGAEIVITSEFGVTGYPSFPELRPEEQNFRSREDIESYVEPIKGVSFKYFGALAKELGIYIQYGLATADSKSAPYHNTAVVVGPSGKVEVYHHKIGLFEMENNYLEPGKKGGIFNSPVGRVGLMICADTYDSEVLSQYDGQTDVIFLSTSWARYNSGMNQFKSTARQLKSYLLAANHMYYPDSGVINPDGNTQSHIRQSSGIAYGYLPRRK